jgi:hypothetical protein
MDSNKQVQVLQMVYAAALADMTLQLNKEGILERVIERKHLEQMQSGKMRAAQFGIAQPADVFLKLAELFDCASWTIKQNEDGSLIALSSVCKLCAIAKKMGAPAPCHLYCLDPMEGMLKALKPLAAFKVQETLWNGAKCVVRVE